MIEVTPEPGPDLRITEHDAPGSWLQDMRARDYCVPLQLCHDVSHGMTALGLPFADVFRLLWRHRKILQVGHVLIYDLSGPRLWEGPESLREDSGRPRST